MNAPRIRASLAALSLALVTPALALGAFGCAKGEARPDAAGGRVDASVPPGVDAHVPDAYVPPGVDANVPDAYVAPGIDAFVPGVDAARAPDAAVVGTGGYLDRCDTAADCASGRCVADRGGTSFCSRTCASDATCAHEHTCVSGVCVPDDTGEACSTATPETCAAGLCLGSDAGGQCTRQCSSAAECPAGYACTQTGGASFKICVDIERPCATAAECGTGLCVTDLGCTAECVTAADCPARLPGLPAYTCGTDYGTSANLCVIPSDVVGDDAAGASCVTDASGLYECRSGACDETAPLGAMCVASCTARGGCGPGLGCYPLIDGSTLYMVCERAGSGDLGSSCSTGRNCTSGLCDGTGVCTRLCADGICPTGWSCEAVAGYSVSICRP